MSRLPLVPSITSNTVTSNPATRHSSSGNLTMKARRVLVLLAGVGVIALAAGPAASADANAQAAVQVAPSIRVVSAAKRELVERRSVTGTVLPRQEAAVGIDLSGMIVTKLNADQGDRVEKGQVLAVLDRSMLDTQLAQMDASRAQAQAAAAQATAQITDAEVAVRQAREQLDRARALQERGVAARSQLDTAVNSYDSAQARLVSAQRAVSAAEAQIGVIDAQKENVLLQISKTDVKAPASGLVLERTATLGGVVGAQVGPLFRIAIDAEFELVADVPETDLARMAEGMPVAVSLAGRPEPIEGKIRLISPEIDRTTRLGRVRVLLPKDSGARSGNFARGTIEVLREEGVTVPTSAILYRGRDAFLQKVADDVVRTVPVSLGARADGMIEITDGLAEGDRVVSRAGTFVADGDRITPVETKDAEAAQ